MGSNNNRKEGEEMNIKREITIDIDDIKVDLRKKCKMLEAELEYYQKRCLKLEDVISTIYRITNEGAAISFKVDKYPKITLIKYDGDKA